MIKLMLAICLLSQIKEINPNKKWEVEIVTRQTEDYLLLTKNTPLTFSAEGPTYLRVYTRIFWPKDKMGSQIYKLILQENKIDENIITLESEKSEVTKDKKGRPLSKWRSFYIEIPEGSSDYRLTHWSSPNDTILVKFAYESPKKWNEIQASDYDVTIEAIEEEKILKYYELKRGDDVSLTVNGPARLRIISRLNFDEKMIGDQNYTITVAQGADIEKFAHKCYKSQIITYRDRKNIVPSNARSFHMNVREGRHTLKFTLTGTVAESAALRFLVEEK